MIEQVIPYFGKIRIWLDELPDAAFPSQEVDELVLLGSRSVRFSHAKAAVEVSLPTGARFDYGLLGAEATHTESENLTVCIPRVSVGRDRSFIDPPYKQLKDVRVGMTRELSAGLEKCVQALQDRLAPLPAGRVEFTCAAHEPTGSSERVFKGLCGMVLHLLCADHAYEQEDLKKLLERHMGS